MPIIFKSGLGISGREKGSDALLEYILILFKKNIKSSHY